MAEEITTKINKRPKLCCIDLLKENVDALKNEGFNIYSGSLGDQVQVPTKTHNSSYPINLNLDLPDNLHEFDIIIIDLVNTKTIKYNPLDHVIDQHTGKKLIQIVCSYPETIFNPKPYSSMILKERLKFMGSKDHMIITFTSEDYDVEYEIVEFSKDRTKNLGTRKYNIYSYAGNIRMHENISGLEMEVCEVEKDLKHLLKSSIVDSYYNQSFNHPLTVENDRYVPDPRFEPLIKNLKGDIVSFVVKRDHSIHFFLPQIKNKYSFLSTFLKNIAPDFYPELFPFSTTFIWKEKKEYWLPNQDKLYDEKKNLITEYEAKLKYKDEEIIKNKDKFTFLHNLISESGENLVNSTIVFLKWLGFENVVNADELKKNGQVLEEDIQVEFEKGLLIIECKGIGGTSTDSDCNQISKIRFRRCIERDSFDVFALYIVNHQRYLPPLHRSNPPFSKIQVQDAKNEKRGLLSTWQLFNLYFEIENGIITKEEARNAIIENGLVEFKPMNLTFIDETKKIYRKGQICIVNIKNINLSVGDELYIEKNDRFYKHIIKEIQVNSENVKECSDGELGLKLDIPVKKNSKIWKKVIKTESTQKSSIRKV